MNAGESKDQGVRRVLGTDKAKTSAFSCIENYVDVIFICGRLPETNWHVLINSHNLFLFWDRDTCSAFDSSAFLSCYGFFPVAHLRALLSLCFTECWGVRFGCRGCYQWGISQSVGFSRSTSVKTLHWAQ